MADVYILYSPILKKFYIGSCQEFTVRIEQHRYEKFPKAFTAKAKDWVIYFRKENLNYAQARKIETHIKKMKSKKYFEDLKRYPEIFERLVKLYE